MASLLKRYMAGEREQVWREIDVGHLPLAEVYEKKYDRFISGEEIDEVMRETFQRVSRNIDRLIGRLRELNYRFESETSEYSEPEPPRRRYGPEVFEAIGSISKTFEVMRAFKNGQRSFPRSIELFAEIVGAVDLTQAWVADNQMHPVLAMLGDFDPLVVDVEHFTQDAQEDYVVLPTPVGGMGMIAEFAPSFEHKANVSGAENPHFFLPTDRNDPICLLYTSPSPRDRG